MEKQEHLFGVIDKAVGIRMLFCYLGGYIDGIENPLVNGSYSDKAMYIATEGFEYLTVLNGFLGHSITSKEINVLEHQIREYIDNRLK